MFTHMRRTIDRRTSFSFSYRSCGYGPNMQAVPEKWLTGDENAIVDFRYTPSQRLTWYFDHHVTSFTSEEERSAALASSARYVHDPDYGSCTKLIVDIAKERHGVDFDAYDELVVWADRIDRAAFESAEAAIDRSHPVTQLAGVVEQNGDAPLYDRLVGELLTTPLVEVAQSEHVAQLWQPIDAARRETKDRIGRGMERHGEVTFVDLHEAPLRASGKFVAYALAPDCIYSVALIRMKQHFKISIGYNPWCGKERRHDIGSICQRYGGGGHAVVGAVSVPLAKLEEARSIVRTIMEELGR
jgi:hypothetical protein